MKKKNMDCIMLHFVFGDPLWGNRNHTNIFKKSRQVASTKKLKEEVTKKEPQREERTEGNATEESTHQQV